VVRALVFSVACSLCSLSVADERWDWEITPYLWAVGQSGETGTDDVTLDFDVSFSDILSNLDMALLVDLSVQDERWGVNMDAVFMDVGADAEFERADADLDIAETVVSVSGFLKSWKTCAADAYWRIQKTYR